MLEEDQAAPPQAMESEQGEGDKEIAPSSPQQSQQVSSISLFHASTL